MIVKLIRHDKLYKSSRQLGHSSAEPFGKHLRRGLGKLDIL